MDYKLCILAAGIGSRMMPITKNINKALLPINFKAAISHLIDKFPEDKEIVIAVNYEKSKIKEYLDCVYPERNIKFVYVDKIEGIGSGPGYSLICCKKYLQTPFVLTAVDTLVQEKYPPPDTNWMGIQTTIDSQDYCSVALEENTSRIISILDKSPLNTNEVFIGLAGIKDFELFFSSLEKDKSEVKGEKQLSNGFKGLIENGLFQKNFDWTDIGKLKNYHEANERFSGAKNSFDFSKTDEYIYFEKDNVIKYFTDEKTIKNRFYRSILLKELTPKIEFLSNNFYAYKKIPGKVVYELKDPIITNILLHWLKENLWIKRSLNSSEQRLFEAGCYNFYYSKTYKRISTFFEKFKVKDISGKINGEDIPSAEDLINKIDFNWIIQGIPTNFHGDLQFDNILYVGNEKFKLLDWRQDFAGFTEYGDQYYDLAKLNGGLSVSYKKVKEGDFKYSFDKSDCIISINDDIFLKDSKKIFNEFVINNKLDLKKIEILTGLIFLNMSPMHNFPFSHYVYNLGRLKLYKALLNKN